MDKIKYSISIVCYNNIALTKRCINSILKYSKDFELIIWNNGSNDGTKEYLESLRKICKIQIHHNNNNIGFTIPQNRNSEKANGKYYVILNNDVEVCERWLDKLSDPFENENMGIVGIAGNPCVLKENAQGYIADKLEYIEASCLMTLKSIIEKYGLFDEKHFKFAYCEDADFSLKLREKGYLISQIYLKIKHNRASTSDIINIDYQGYAIKNKVELLNKYPIYFKNRNFKYKILIDRAGALGDVIMATPIVHALKKKYPLSEIYVKTRCPEVFNNNPEISGIVNNEQLIRENEYDLYYDLNLAYERFNKLLIVDAYALFTIDIEDYQLRLYTDSNIDKQIYNKYKNNKVIIFHTKETSNWSGRNFDINKYKEAAEYLKQKGYYIIELNTNKTNIKCDEYYSMMQFDKLCSMIKYSKMFIGQDSGIFHIAQAFNIPNIVPFGMIKPETRIINNKYSYPLIANNVNCLGCHQWQPGIRTTVVPCPRDKIYCMEKITVEDVINNIDKAIKEHGI